LLFIITEYFHPFSDAGGPIRSIENLIKLFPSSQYFKLITSANSHQGECLPRYLKSDCFVLEPVSGSEVFFSKSSFKSYCNLFFLFYFNRNHTFYINGLFIPRLSFLPTLICKNVIISPRGMLIKDSFGKMAFLKKLYLFLFKKVISKHAVWHATDKNEALDIKSFFGANAKIQLIPNIPVKPFEISKRYTKELCSLRLVYFGLIAQKKGLLVLIQTLKSLSYPVSLDIYGSVKDQSFWKLCLNELNNNNSLASFSYKGHANPAESQTILAGYDAFVLLTKGENFGHSIYEALSVGTPVIISNKTPWSFSDSSSPPGWVIDYANDEFDLIKLKNVMQDLYKIDSHAYNSSSVNAHKYAVEFYNSHDFKKQYSELFNSFSLEFTF
jgi:glycosyltransferase involved in cell wall biosynthesis